jgi:CheY-like chemotaxis protein
MEDFVVPIDSGFSGNEPRIRLLLADDHPAIRSLLAGFARDTVRGIVVLEAEDGAEAVQLGLQQQPHIALLDVNMPRLGGIEVAITLRELRPQMRLALQTADLHLHRDRARAHRLPLFDKLEPDRALSWLALQVRALGAPGLVPRTLECSSCGYGIACSRPPDRCPMCQGQHGWIRTSLPNRRGLEPVV